MKKIVQIKKKKEGCSNVVNLWYLSFDVEKRAASYW